MSDVSFTGWFSLAHVCADTFGLCTFLELLGDGISHDGREQITRCQIFCVAVALSLLDIKVNLSMKSLWMGNKMRNLSPCGL